MLHKQLYSFKFSAVLRLMMMAQNNGDCVDRIEIRDDTPHNCYCVCVFVATAYAKFDGKHFSSTIITYIHSGDSHIEL